MYVIAYKLNDKIATIAASNKTVAMRELGYLQQRNFGNVWRAMDNIGWCDGSPDVWKEISFIPNNATLTSFAFR